MIKGDNVFNKERKATWYSKYMKEGEKIVRDKVTELSRERKR
jgi:hypothetical protein